jgi:hypothetical protein
MLTPASGTAEREAAVKMIVQRSPGSRRLTLGADKGYDTKTFVADLRDLNIAPHVAQNTTNRASAIDCRTTRHPGYTVSQTIRKRIEESFAWAKTIAGLRKTKHRRVGRVPVHLRHGGLQSDPDAQIAFSRYVTPPKSAWDPTDGTAKSKGDASKENTALSSYKIQHPALMFAFKEQGAVFYSAAADCADRGAPSRRQDPKTPVEQALMRGLGTA